MSKVFSYSRFSSLHRRAWVRQPLDLRVTPQAAQSPAQQQLFLKGDDAPRTHTRTFSGLPAGSYEESARVVRNDGTDDVIATTVVVSGQPR